MDSNDSFREPAVPATTAETAGPPTKRQKRASASESVLRKGRACSTCRKLKIKCDSSDRDVGSCSRCQRLGLQCIRKRPWINAEGEEGWQQQTNTTIFKLERALEDVLEKLNMPALDMYAQTPIVEPVQSPRSTRHNSQEPVAKRGDRDVSPGPMRSLIEATRLNGLFSQLRSGRQRRKGGMRRMDTDLISEKVITYEQAEELFELFKVLLSPHLYSATIPPDATLETVRTSSTVLFTAIMLVGALHISGYEQIHEVCHGRFLGLVSSAIFDRFHTLDDIRGLCIAAFWQPDLSWKLSGLCIRMATELNLHHAFYEAFYTPDITEDARRESLEKTRLWYLLFVLDHQSSIAYGRPPVMAELRPIKDYEVLLTSPWCTAQDRALIAQVTGFVILSKAFETFGLEPKRTMGGDDASVLNHFRFTEDARAWKERWQTLPHIESFDGNHRVPSGDVELYFHFSDLVLHSLVLRGRPLENLQDLPTSLRPLTLRAIEAAHALLRHFIEDSGSREGLVGMPLYLHSMIAFAVVFLVKISHWWHVIGITIDPSQQSRPLIDGIIKLLRSCKAGANHMVFSMANGFDRMLKQASRQGRMQPIHRDATAARGVSWMKDSEMQRNRSSWELSEQAALENHNQSPASAYILENQRRMMFDPNAPPIDPNNPYNMPPTAEVSPYENWDFQDEELWTLGMGYDLLAPGGEGLPSADFPFTFVR